MYNLQGNSAVTQRREKNEKFGWKNKYIIIPTECVKVYRKVALKILC